MPSKNIHTRIKHKHGFEYEWLAAVNFVPFAGELIIYDKEVDSDGNAITKVVDDVETPVNQLAGRTEPIPYSRLKVGDGNTTVTNLPFASEGPYKTTIVNVYEDPEDWVYKSTHSVEQIYEDLHFGNNVVLNWESNIYQCTDCSDTCATFTRFVVSDDSQLMGEDPFTAYCFESILIYDNGTVELPSDSVGGVSNTVPSLLSMERFIDTKLFNNGLFDTVTREELSFEIENHTHSAESVGARPDTWLPTVDEIGAVDREEFISLQDSVIAIESELFNTHDLIVSCDIDSWEGSITMDYSFSSVLDHYKSGAKVYVEYENCRYPCVSFSSDEALFDVSRVEYEKDVAKTITQHLVWRSDEKAYFTNELTVDSFNIVTGECDIQLSFRGELSLDESNRLQYTGNLTAIGDELHSLNGTVVRVPAHTSFTLTSFFADSSYTDENYQFRVSTLPVYLDVFYSYDNGNSYQYQRIDNSSKFFYTTNEALVAVKISAPGKTYTEQQMGSTVTRVIPPVPGPDLISQGIDVVIDIYTVHEHIKDVDEHIDNKSNPHGTTKDHLGLDRVENKSSEDIRNEITSENIINALQQDAEMFKGPKGDSGVYIGSGEMPEGYNVQIDPNGTPITYNDLVASVLASLPIYNGEVV